MSAAETGRPEGAGEERPEPESTLERALEGKAARKLRAREEGDRGVWFGLGMMGLVGWSAQR